MSSDKTSTLLGLIRHATTLRLTRIATLVVGSLVFLYACEVSRNSDLSDVWVQVAVATGFALTGLTTAWFEVKAADHAATRARTDIRGFHIESDGITVRARITRSGDLVFHGHDTSGAHPAYEWDWAFRASTFPAIRTALGGGRGDLLDLLEHTAPDLDRHERYDPGAWLYNQGIPAAFRERGDTSHRITRKLPVVGPDASRPAPSRETIGAHQLSNTHRNPDVDSPRPTRSSRREPPPDQAPPVPTRRRTSARQDPRTSAKRPDEPPAGGRGQPSHTRRRAKDRWEAQPEAHAGRTPSDRSDAAPSDGWDAPSSDQWDDPPARPTGRSGTPRYEASPDNRVDPSAARRGAPATRHPEQPPYEPGTPTHARRRTPADPRQSEPSSSHWNEPPATRYRAQAADFRETTGWPRDKSSGAHRHVLSGAHPSEPPPPDQREQQAQRRDEQPGRRHRRS
ncbi:MULTISPECIES: hypothetical protein [unclassified Nocardia]|uniref:hypothetical protein n=1 Tax=unclassified Nocardia TaxID=2637762 RepID=UPI003445848C